MTTMPTISSDLSFDAAAALVLSYLRDHVPVNLWAVTRVENDRQTMLFLDDQGLGVTAGFSVAWENTFCVRMVAGLTPAVAPRISEVPEYVVAAEAAGMDVGAYAGAVISEPDGTLFGTICGVDVAEQDDNADFAAVGPLLQLLGQLLSMVLAAERRRDQDRDALLRAQLDAETDSLTGLYNRRAWRRVLEQEESRFARLADPTVALVLDLDLLKNVNDRLGHDVGDDYIRLAATTLRQTVREDDVVARIGGDEFGVLMVGCSELEAQIAVRRIYEAFEDAGVAGSVGWAPMTVVKGFPAALAEADAAMYAAKARRRSDRAAVARQDRPA